RVLHNIELSYTCLQDNTQGKPDPPPPRAILHQKPPQILVLASESFVDPLCIDWLQVLKLLSISYRLVESWEFPSRSLSGGSGPRAQISPKLTELKMGIMLLIKANQDVPEIFTDTSTLQLAPYGNYYQSLEADESLRRTYELLACFKKDMHKVETYLTVAKCRLSPEANCTL
uniref:Somatotropin n=1 Tax=Xiphophorus couchianus TaxID=32473 RepID=A0A3B5MT48_9TELE